MRRTLENDFLNHPNDPLLVWDSGSNDYGQALLFLVYLFEQYGGVDTIRRLVAEPANSINGINNTLYHFGLKVFPATILGGLDSILGAALGGLSETQISLT